MIKNVVSLAEKLIKLKTISRNHKNKPFDFWNSNSVL
jgi:hypothetical protein